MQSAVAMCTADNVVGPNQIELEGATNSNECSLSGTAFALNSHSNCAQHLCKPLTPSHVCRCL